MECMDSVLRFKCPAENTDPELRAELDGPSVKCQVCELSDGATSLDDMDPREDRTWFQLQWGPNMLSSGSGTNESMIDGYKVYVVDACERKRELVGTVPKSAKAVEPPSNACCTPNAYSIVVGGTIPEDGKKLMIVPFQGGFELEAGRTVVIADGVEGVVEIVTGSIKVEVDNPTAFANDRKVLTQLAQALADSLEGVDSGMIRIVDVISARRLEEASTPRKLAGIVVVNYEVLIPSGHSVTASKVKTAVRSIKSDDLEKTMNSRLTDYDVIAVLEIADPTSNRFVGRGSGHLDAASRVLPIPALVGWFVVCGLVVSGARLV